MNECPHGLFDVCCTNYDNCSMGAPEPEPVAYLCENAVGHKYFRWKKPQIVFNPVALYTTPPQRKEWVGLTEKEKTDIAIACGALSVDWVNLASAIEAKLKDKNGF